MRKGDVIVLEHLPAAVAYAAGGGRRELDGPLGSAFDIAERDTRFGQKTWEMAESELARRTLETAFGKVPHDIGTPDVVFAGDLQCQCTASGYAMRSEDVPFAGLYGACSTMAESAALAACLVDGGFAACAAAMASSHFCAAERQFRTPLGYGAKRTPTAQWTVTGAGAVVFASGRGPRVRAVQFGRVRDLGVFDATNMGAAMAPAAAETLVRYFDATGETPDAFDAVYTGDLGAVGSNLLGSLLELEGVRLQNHRDCGLEIYGRTAPGSGASGAGCSAAVLCGHILPMLARGEMRRVLFLATGALMSQTTSLQGESIPGVAHLMEFCSEEAMACS